MAFASSKNPANAIDSFARRGVRRPGLEDSVRNGAKCQIPCEPCLSSIARLKLGVVVDTERCRSGGKEVALSRADFLRFGSSSMLRWSAVFCSMALLAMAGCREDSKGSSTSQKLTADDGSTGVPLCDSYLDQYETCVVSALPPSQVQRHRTGIVRQREAWRTLADSASKQESLRRICRSAIETARQEFPSCVFSGS